MSSSDEEQRPGPSEVEHVSESTSTAAEAGQEQRGHSRLSSRQRVPERDEYLIENDLLISLVQERVPLRDTRVPQHSDNVTIRRLWNEVAKAMWDGWDNAPTRVRNAFVLKVKTRWRSMKDRFSKYLHQESRVPSGSGARIQSTWSSTVGTGSGAVLHQTATDPSQPSCSKLVHQVFPFPSPLPLPLFWGAPPGTGRGHRIGPSCPSFCT
ncbi:uncharacterized protein [Ranitomeya imitator]|uniref:uncharacterized protein n=1 Tax=Ranitomeya imitator TaxID=111125 RepID=UPI0037E9789F